VSDAKQTNPKDNIGSRKWRQYFCVPVRVAWEVGIAHLAGLLKYGGINWRGAGVQASVYVDAAKGHIDQFVEGEDLDPESQAHHIAHAIAGLNILLDCILRGEDAWTDDRPPKTPDLDKVREETQRRVDRLFEMFPNPPPRCTELNYRDGNDAWNGGVTKEPSGEEGEDEEPAYCGSPESFEIKIQGNYGIYNTIEEWQKAEPNTKTAYTWKDGAVHYDFDGIFEKACIARGLDPTKEYSYDVTQQKVVEDPEK
jgi:hypothetical protein